MSNTKSESRTPPCAFCPRDSTTTTHYGGREWHLCQTHHQRIRRR